MAASTRPHYGGQAELTRYEVVSGGARQAELIEIDLRQALLAAIRPPIWRCGRSTTWSSRKCRCGPRRKKWKIRGEVRFPGRYPIHRGETLRSVMERAGGLTDLAFPEGRGLHSR